MSQQLPPVVCARRAFIAAVDDVFDLKPAAFKVGEQNNEEGTNLGSAKVFSVAKMGELSEEETLQCFGQFYNDVKETPDGTDHANIRNFMKFGWKGVEFPSGLPLVPKASYEYSSAESMY